MTSSSVPDWIRFEFENPSIPIHADEYVVECREPETVGTVHVPVMLVYVTPDAGTQGRPDTVAELTA
jgi:hypothetical protein